MRRMDYQTKEPRLAELDAKSQDRYSRPFVELDADQRAELREEVYDQPAAPQEENHFAAALEAFEA